MKFSELVEKNLNEKKDIHSMKEDLEQMTMGKHNQKLWDWFMDNLDDLGIYAGDAVPEDYIEAMNDKQTVACYKAMKKYIKKR